MKSLLSFLLAFIALPGFAQQISGSVVTDHNSPCHKALVLISKGGNLIDKVHTDGKGSYTTKLLTPGYYDVAVVYHNFDSAKAIAIKVVAGQVTKKDFKLSNSKQKLEMEIALSAKKKHEAWSNKRRAPGDVGLVGGGNTGMAYQWSKQYDGLPSPPPYPTEKPKAQFFNPSEESYKKVAENDFMNVKVSPLSTMSVDVDRASYSNVRRFINDGSKPPADAVRVEEMINYFEYEYPQPRGEDPIAIQTELTDCPWQKDHKLLHVGMQALKVKTDNLPPSNLVFLIDVSGSMDSPERLPLLVSGMKLLVNNLRAIDKVTIVTYAGNAGLVLPPTPGSDKQTILDALNKLNAGGSTAGGAGIKLAYSIAAEQFVKGGNNRVLLATDGDFNVGVSSDNELEDLIVKERETGIFLTCLGFGTGNYKDAKMEMLADKGNGNYDYIDNIQEAQKTLVSEFGGTLFTVAKDVKAQIEYNPAKVQGYRLVGYENRMLNTEDFKDDKKDAGDMGSGHTVTIIYEIIPVGIKSTWLRDATDLKYQQPEKTNATFSNELATIKFRYKKPDGVTSKEITHTIKDETLYLNKATESTRFSTSVAMFGMLLKDSKYKGTSRYEDVLALAETSRKFDKDGYRAEYIRLVKAAKGFGSNKSVE